MSVVHERSNVVLRSPAEFAAAIPALLGFSPQDSLVAVFLGEGQVIVTMRVDLPEDLEDFTEHATGVACRVGADAVVLAVCCPRGVGDLPLHGGVEALIGALEDDGVAVKDALLIDSGRYWSYGCQSPCCPPEGVPIPEDHALEAERVGAGMPAVAGSRDAVIERYRPRPESAPGPVAMATAEAILRVPLAERARQCWDEVRMLASGTATGDEVVSLMVARVQLAMGDVRVRDYVLGSIALSESGTDALVEVVVQAALTAPAAVRPRIAGAAAALLSACGDSSVAVSCLLDLAGDESLAELVRVGQSIPMPPAQVRELFVSAMPMVEALLARADGEEATGSK
jgi:hypothetical protein